MSTISHRLVRLKEFQWFLVSFDLPIGILLQEKLKTMTQYISLFQNKLDRKFTREIKG
jgi:hypothetical protein